MMHLLATMSAEEREKLATMIGEFATQVVERPPAEREEFIRQAVGRVRSMYRGRYRTDALALVGAQEFSDRLEDWIRQTVASLEQDGTGSAG